MCVSSYVLFFFVYFLTRCVYFLCGKIFVGLISVTVSWGWTVTVSLFQETCSLKRSFFSIIHAQFDWPGVSNVTDSGVSVDREDLPVQTSSVTQTGNNRVDCELCQFAGRRKQDIICKRETTKKHKRQQYTQISLQ